MIAYFLLFVSIAFWVKCHLARKSIRTEDGAYARQRRAIISQTNIFFSSLGIASALFACINIFIFRPVGAENATVDTILRFEVIVHELYLWINAIKLSPWISGAIIIFLMWFGNTLSTHEDRQSARGNQWLASVWTFAHHFLRHLYLKFESISKAAFFLLVLMASFSFFSGTYFDDAKSLELHIKSALEKIDRVNAEVESLANETVQTTLWEQTVPNLPNSPAGQLHTFFDIRRDAGSVVNGVKYIKSTFDADLSKLTQSIESAEKILEKSRNVMSSEEGATQLVMPTKIRFLSAGEVNAITLPFGLESLAGVEKSVKGLRKNLRERVAKVLHLDLGDDLAARIAEAAVAGTDEFIRPVMEHVPFFAAVFETIQNCAGEIAKVHVQNLEKVSIIEEPLSVKSETDFEPMHRIAIVQNKIEVITLECLGANPLFREGVNKQLDLTTINDAELENWSVEMESALKVISQIHADRNETLEVIKGGLILYMKAAGFFGGEPVRGSIYDIIELYKKARLSEWLIADMRTSARHLLKYQMSKTPRNPKAIIDTIFKDSEFLRWAAESKDAQRTLGSGSTELQTGNSLGIWQTWPGGRPGVLVVPGWKPPNFRPPFRIHR